jgi:hypothetical protein
MEKFWCCLNRWSRVLFISAIFTNAWAQQPAAPQNRQPSRNLPGVYLLSIIPKEGGKSYTLFHRTKVQITFVNGRQIKGKVSGVSRDSVSINFNSFAISDISELRFSQGSTIGLIAAGAMLVGVAAIAIVGSKDNRSSTEEAIFWSGVGLAAAGAITLIPTHFIKKKFSSLDYEFRAVPAN